MIEISITHYNRTYIGYFKEKKNLSHERLRAPQYFIDKATIKKANEM